MLLINLSSKLELQRLTEVADDLKERIEAIPGILEVRRVGGVEAPVLLRVDGCRPRSPRSTRRVSTTPSTPSVRAYAVLIASNEQEAEGISAALDVGRGYVCTDTSQLASTFEKIFQASVAVS